MSRSHHRKRQHVDNWLSERRTDDAYTGLRGACCGHHPDTHDLLVGCLLCDCQEGQDIELPGQIWYEEAPALVSASPSDIDRAARLLGIRWQTEESTGHRFLEIKDFRRVAHAVRQRQDLERRAYAPWATGSTVPLYAVGRAREREEGGA